MAKRVRTIVEIYDDLSGELLPEGEGQTITFAWRGKSYEIDLSNVNAAQLDDFMQKITSASRRLDTKGKGHSHKAKPVPGPQGGTEGLPPAAQKALSAAESAQEARARGQELTPYQEQMERRNFLRDVRLWAQENGFPDQAMSGRIKPDVREAWDRAHPDRPIPPEAETASTRRARLEREQLAIAG